MLRAKDDGTAQGNYGATWLVDVYPGSSHHPLREAFSAISNKAYENFIEFISYNKGNNSKRIIVVKAQCREGKGIGVGWKGEGGRRRGASELHGFQKLIIQIYGECSYFAFC